MAGALRPRPPVTWTPSDAGAPRGRRRGRRPGRRASWSRPTRSRGARRGGRRRGAARPSWRAGGPKVARRRRRLRLTRPTSTRCVLAGPAGTHVDGGPGPPRARAGPSCPCSDAVDDVQGAARPRRRGPRPRRVAGRGRRRVLARVHLPARPPRRGPASTGSTRSTWPAAAPAGRRAPASTTGPCAGTALDWRDGEWQRRRGRLGPRALLVPRPDRRGGLLPGRAARRRCCSCPPSRASSRVTARLAASRRDRLTAHLPMLRRPHPEGLVGAVRVEVRGRTTARAGRRRARGARPARPSPPARWPRWPPAGRPPGGSPAGAAGLAAARRPAAVPHRAGRHRHQGRGLRRHRRVGRPAGAFLTARSRFGVMQPQQTLALDDIDLSDLEFWTRPARRAGGRLPHPPGRGPDPVLRRSRDVRAHAGRARATTR